jgi:acyl-CoA reductase-like NAD-dependent aldehyde dehydrogenase
MSTKDDFLEGFGPRKNNNGVYKQFIDGEWHFSLSNSYKESRNPAHKGQLLGLVASSTEEEAEKAVEAAQRDFMAWKNISSDIKTKIFLEVANLFTLYQEEMNKVITHEMGKTLFDAKLDTDEAIGVLQVVAPMGLSMKGHTYQNIQEGLHMESRREPRGVATIITPFNFPCAIPIAQIAAALVTGNTVVWKPSHLNPEISQAMVQMIMAAIKTVEERYRLDIPRGILNMIFGGKKTIAEHPAVKTISFTGSKETGDRVGSVASGFGKIMMKEVGGINITYVHQKANLNKAADQFLYGKTITGGQRCSSIQEVLIDEPVFNAFLEIVKGKSKGIVIDDGSSEKIRLADATSGQYSLPPLVDEEQCRRVLTLTEQSINEGARILHQISVPDPLRDEGYYVPFTILGGVDEKNVLYGSEVFGPVAIFTTVKDINEAIQITNEKIGIVACIHSEDKNATEHFLHQVLRTRVDDGRHGTGCFWSTKFGGDRGAGGGNPSLDDEMVNGYTLWKTIYRNYDPL